jgi:hypothetical protein
MLTGRKTSDAIRRRGRRRPCRRGPAHRPGTISGRLCAEWAGGFAWLRHSPAQSPVSASGGHLPPRCHRARGSSSRDIGLLSARPRTTASPGTHEGPSTHRHDGRLNGAGACLAPAPRFGDDLAVDGGGAAVGGWQSVRVFLRPAAPAPSEIVPTPPGFMKFAHAQISVRLTVWGERPGWAGRSGGIGS